MPCYRIDFEGATSDRTPGVLVTGNGVLYPAYRSFTTFSWGTKTITEGWGGYYNGTIFYEAIYDGVASGEVSATNRPPVAAPGHPDCPPESLPPTEIKYDCINGNCIDSTVYGTSGIYSSLENCESNCGNSSQCQEGSDCVVIQDTETLKNLLG